MYGIALSNVASFFLPFWSAFLDSPRRPNLGFLRLSRLQAIHELIL